MEIIKITRGDDTDALGQKISIVLNTDIDLTGWSATFQLVNFRTTFNDISNKKLYLKFNKEDTRKLPLGFQTGALKIYNPEGKAHTVIRDIGFEILSEVVRND
jgi:hypothetical protein